MKNIAVLLPGLMGSILKLGNEEIWPGPVSSLVLPYSNMDKLLSTELVATDVIRNYTIFSEQYGSLIRDLNKAGFSEAASTLHVFPYDWRKSNVEAAASLAEKLDSIVHENGEDPAKLNVTLLAHSMGGLVSRYYLECGKYRNRPGFDAVRFLITLGTPHLGSPLALSAALGNEKRLFLSKDQVAILVNKPEFPSIYELLPPTSVKFVFNGTAASKYGALNIYEKDLVTKLGLSRTNIATAQSFHSALNLQNRPDHIRYFFFGGSHQVTYSHVIFASKGQSAELVPAYVSGHHAGDGTVPIWSSMATMAENHIVGGEHGTIYKDDSLRLTLALLLGYEGVLEIIGNVQVSVRDRVAEPDSTIHVSLSFPPGTTEVEGGLRIESSDLSGHIRDTGTVFPIRYSGLQADLLSVTLRAPSYAGFYKVVFYENSKRLGEDELFVQEISIS